MEKIEIKGINYDLLEELNIALQKGVAVFKDARNENKKVTDTTVKEFVNGTIDSWIEAAKGDVCLTPTIRELDIQELKKLDAVLYRDEQVQTPSSIKASDLSDKAVNLYVAMVCRVYKGTVKSCEEVYSSEELARVAQGYRDFTQEYLSASGDKTKKFDATRKAMALLRSSASIRENQNTQQQIVTR